MSGIVKTTNPDDIPLEVTDLYTGRNGDCRGCVGCCTRLLPMTPRDTERLQFYVEEHGIVPNQEQSGSVNLMCPFIDEEQSICRVYEARPEICCHYRCDKDARKEFDLPLDMLLAARLVDLRVLFDCGTDESIKMLAPFVFSENLQHSANVSPRLVRDGI